MDIETLAKELHEAGRAAVEQGATVAAEKFGEKTRVFLSWAEITEPAREGRRIQARYLLNKFFVLPRPFKADQFQPQNSYKVGDFVKLSGVDVQIIDVCDDDYKASVLRKETGV